jgi:choline dehydrogenase
VGPADELGSVGIDPTLDLPGVGANLADHVGTEVDLGWTGPPIPDDPILHSIATFRSPDRGDGAPDVLYWLSDPFGDEPAFSIETVLMKPVARGRVRIASADPAEPPRITVPDPTIAADFDRITAAWLRSIEIANDPELRALAGIDVLEVPRDPAEIRDRIDASRYSLPHVVGTCRMGPDPLDGAVVDTRCRVHGIEGLLVADASIIPEPPAGFPHVIVLMLAERVAAMLA